MARVTRPTDVASLAAFRILFGLLMAAAMIRLLSKGWVRELYVAPAFHFTYPGFDWVRPWPEPFMTLHFVALALLALGVAAGIYYRFCITLFFVGFTYVELIDQTAYLNHYYLITLLSWLMIFLPAHRAWSFDAHRVPALRSDIVPAWTVMLLRFQVGIVYFFAGLAKLNSDWLFHAQPLRIWLAARSDVPWIGQLLDEAWVAYAASWFGALYDLTIVAFLLWRPTRTFAYLAVVVFHVATWVLFNIGTFPWIMIVASTLFFPHEWPRTLLHSVAYLAARVRRLKFVSGSISRIATRHVSPFREVCRTRPIVLAGVMAYALIQLALPLRAYLLNGDHPAWTCRGFNFAWQVMVAEKTGFVEYYAREPATGGRQKINLRSYLTARQALLMAQDPDLVRAMAKKISEDLSARGTKCPEVTVEAFASLNGRPSQRFINANLNVAGALPQEWILPLR
jgi:hypothetical protein